MPVAVAEKHTSVSITTISCGHILYKIKKGDHKGKSKCDNTQLKCTQPHLSSYLHLQWPMHLFLGSQSIFEGSRCPRGWNHDSFTEFGGPRTRQLTENIIQRVTPQQSDWIKILVECEGHTVLRYLFTRHSLSGAWVWFLFGAVCWRDTFGHTWELRWGRGYPGSDAPPLICCKTGVTDRQGILGAWPNATSAHQRYEEAVKLRWG